MSANDMSRLYCDLQGRAAAAGEKERVVQQKRLVLAELRNQVQQAKDDLGQYRTSLASVKQQFLEKKRIVDEKVRAKESHNAAQRESVRSLERQEADLQAQIADVNRAIDIAVGRIAQKERESSMIAETDERLTALKAQLEDEDAQLMQLETKVSRLEAADIRRHHQTTDSLKSFPLPQVSQAAASGGLEATATESIILVDDAKF